tara:strand:- start:43 stop:375 length:333 start_codon:yes stop_codon:yes gene_type:complete
MSEVKKILMISIVFIALAFFVSVSADADKKNSADMGAEQLAVGFWPNDSCKETSEAAGFYLHTSGVMLESADKARKSGNEKKSKELYEAVHFLSTLSMHAAISFEAFCKR